MEHEHSHIAMTPGRSSTVEYLKFIGVLIGIALVAWFCVHTYGDATVSDALRWFMGIFFIVFAGFKLIGYKMFVMMFAGYDIVAKRFKAYAYAYPFIELGLGLLYVFDSLPPLRNWLTLLVMAVGSIGVWQEIKKRSGIHCACLGNIIKLPLSTVSLVEDVGMGVMALVMIWL